MREAAVATAIPLRGWGDGMPFRMPDKPEESVGTGFKIVTPGYFQTLGLRLVIRPSARRARYEPARCRWWSSTSRSSGATTRTRTRSANGSWSSRSFRRAADSGPQIAWEIVGVVADEKGQRAREVPPTSARMPASLRIPSSVSDSSRRGSGDAGALIKSIQHAVMAGEQEPGAGSPDDGGADQGGFADGAAAADDAARRLRAAGDAAGVCRDLWRAVVRHREAHAGAGHSRGIGRVPRGSGAHGGRRRRYSGGRRHRRRLGRRDLARRDSFSRCCSRPARSMRRIWLASARSSSPWRWRRASCPAWRASRVDPMSALRQE